MGSHGAKHLALWPKNPLKPFGNAKLSNAFNHLFKPPLEKKNGF